MGKKGIRIMKWKCVRCTEITTSNKKPSSCPYCKCTNCFKFYGAKVKKR